MGWQTQPALRAQIRYRLQQIATKTGHDPRTFAGLVELLCVLEITSRA